MKIILVHISMKCQDIYHILQLLFTFNKKRPSEFLWQLSITFNYNIKLRKSIYGFVIDIPLLLD